MNLLKYANSYINYGLSVLPTTISTKQPAFSLLPTNGNGKRTWDKYNTIIADAELVHDWFFASDRDKGIAIIGGQVSGNLEILDFDNHLGNAKQVFVEFAELLKVHDEPLFNSLVIEKTQSGGYHVFYRCPTIAGNTKLAEGFKSIENEDGSVAERRETIIETRGQGGYAIVAPTPGYELKMGSFENIPTINSEQRDMILLICRSFNEVEDVIDTTKRIESGYAEETSEERPGDAFNRNGNIEDVLTKGGWTKIGITEGRALWRRPGKSSGMHSATFGFVREKLFVFSSNAYPFEMGKSYDKFACYAMIYHKGDFKAAAKDLLKQGYGRMPKSTGSSASKSANSARSKKNDDDNYVAVKTEEDLNDDVYINPKTQPIPYVQRFLMQKYNYRYNSVKELAQFTEKDVEDWKDLDDIVVNELWRELNFGISVNKQIALSTIDTIINSGFSAQFHPFKSYFYNLPPWDGHDYIGDFINLVPVEQGQEKIWERYFRKWIVGVVATATERGLNHNCLVLAGPQGVGKTTIWKKLIPDDLFNYYAVLQINPADKDSKISVTDNFIINLDELESINRDEIGHLKSLITIEQVTVRLPWGKRSKKIRRRASFCGSVNREYFLTDLTGNRRFLAVDVVGKIDFEVPLDINQLYAQALELLNDGFQYWFSMDEIASINEHNKKYQVISPEEELISRYFSLPDPEVTDSEIEHFLNIGLYDFATATEILDVLQKQTSMKLNFNKLAQILKNMGFMQKVKWRDKKTVRGYLVKKVGKRSEEIAF